MEWYWINVLLLWKCFLQKFAICGVWPCAFAHRPWNALKHKRKKCSNSCIDIHLYLKTYMYMQNWMKMLWAMTIYFVIVACKRLTCAFHTLVYYIYKHICNNIISNDGAHIYTNVKHHCHSYILVRIYIHVCTCYMYIVWWRWISSLHTYNI